jgi:hypothetical protein
MLDKLEEPKVKDDAASGNFSLIRLRSPPSERSIIVSAPYFVATLVFEISSSIF